MQLTSKSIVWMGGNVQWRSFLGACPIMSENVPHFHFRIVNSLIRFNPCVSGGLWVSHIVSHPGSRWDMWDTRIELGVAETGRRNGICIREKC